LTVRVIHHNRAKHLGFIRQSQRIKELGNRKPIPRDRSNAPRWRQVEFLAFREFTLGHTGSVPPYKSLRGQGRANTNKVDPSTLMTGSDEPCRLLPPLQRLLMRI
jgi:hypothetical protein